MLLQMLLLIFLLACSGGGGSTSGSGDSDGGGGGGSGPAGGPVGASTGGSNFANTSTWACNDGAPVAFPGAEGFGQCATGGRGGSVCYVTTTNEDSAGETPGSFQYCLNQSGPTTILFKVSGLINGMITSVYADKTIAGQTSPGGIIVRGFQCDNGVYESTYRCNNMILRHLRSRPLLTGEFPDAFRFSGAKNVIVDHSSFENGSDENVELSRSSYITLQNSIVAEPVGDHYRYGGLLINYSKNLFPLGPLSLHHNLIGRSGGRYPEISCEDNDDGPGSSNCTGRTLQFDISSNLILDQEEAMVYNRCTGTNGGNDCEASDPSVRVSLNWRDNYHLVRSTYDSDAGVIYAVLFNTSGNGVYASGNSWSLNANTDTQLADGTVTSSQGSAYNYPSITSTASNQAADYMTAYVGAFPRDTMDTRIISYLSNVNSSPRARTGSTSDGEGIQVGDAHTITSTALVFPTDTDNDGMPDCWESSHGLNPNTADGNATTLSASGGDGISGCTTGYTNLECFLNQLSANRVNGLYITEAACQ